MVWNSVIDFHSYFIDVTAEMTVQCSVLLDNELLASTCYNLEGNECLILFAYAAIQALKNSMDKTYDLSPRVFQFISQLPDDEKPIWIGKYESLMQPPRQKLNDKISEVRPDPNENYYTKKLAEYHTIMVMKAARYFNPLYIASM